jgi:hypothetical protein
MFSSYTHLMTMLAQGWQVAPPVYVRPRWRSRLQSETTYHFVLWNGEKITLVSVLDCPKVQRFLMDNNLSIDHLD